MSNALRSESLEVGTVCTGIGSQTGAAIGKFVGKSVAFCGNHPASWDMADVSVRSESVDRTKTCENNPQRKTSVVVNDAATRMLVEQYPWNTTRTQTLPLILLGKVFGCWNAPALCGCATNVY